jgi:hypothetical protein
VRVQSRNRGNHPRSPYTTSCSFAAARTPGHVMIRSFAAARTPGHVMIRSFAVARTPGHVMIRFVVLYFLMLCYTLVYYGDSVRSGRLCV